MDEEGANVKKKIIQNVAERIWGLNNLKYWTNKKKRVEYNCYQVN